jgi:ankyrin repeat protein
MDVWEYCQNEDLELEELKKILTTENVNIKNNYGRRTPMYILSGNESFTFNMLELSVKLGGGLNIQNITDNTSMHKLLHNKSITFNILEFAVKHGGDLNIKDYLGLTPMHCLCSNESSTCDMLEFAMKHGGNLHIKDRFGYEPVYFLCSEQIHPLLKKINAGIFLLTQLLRYTICGPIILEEIMLC